MRLKRLRANATSFLAGVAKLGVLHRRLRIFLLRLSGWRIGAGVTVEPGCINAFNNVVLEDGVYIGRCVYFDDVTGITIGERTRVGAFSRFLTRSHEIEPSVYRQVLGHDIDRPIHVQRGCWIGAGVTVLPGVTIAEGCVIGAASLVTRSTQPNGLYMGSPARRVRDLPLEGETPAQAIPIRPRFAPEPPRAWPEVARANRAGIAGDANL